MSRRQFCFRDLEKLQQSSWCHFEWTLIILLSKCQDCCIVICWFMQKYTYIYWIHTDAMITDTVIKMHDRKRNDKDAGRLPYKYIHLSLYCKGSKGLFKGLHVRGCWRPNINFIFWPHCYDHHVVSFLFSWFWGPLHRGFSEGPLGRVWPSLPHLSLLPGTLLATAFAPQTQLS